MMTRVLNSLAAFVILMCGQAEGGLIATVTADDSQNDSVNGKITIGIAGFVIGQNPHFADPRWANVKVATGSGDTNETAEVSSLQLIGVLKAPAVTPGDVEQDFVYLLKDPGTTTISDAVQFALLSGSSDLLINFISDGFPGTPEGNGGLTGGYNKNAVYGQANEDAGGNAIPLPAGLPALAGTDSLTLNTDLLKVIMKSDVEPTIIKNTKPQDSPSGGDKHSPTMSYDATTKTLSFTDGTVNFLNVAGDSSNDPQFAADPLMGATISVGNFSLDRTQDQGLVFTGGTLTLSKGNHIFLSADLPNLLLDDTGVATFGNNIFSPLSITQIDTSDPFLNDYQQFITKTGFPAEFFGLTSGPVANLVGANTSFSTDVDVSFGSSFETPEPSAAALLALGALCMLRRRRPSG
jgi:MYXO-CTERM domain-containing protein